MVGTLVGTAETNKEPSAGLEIQVDLSAVRNLSFAFAIGILFS